MTLRSPLKLYTQYSVLSVKANYFRSMKENKFIVHLIPLLVVRGLSFKNPRENLKLVRILCSVSIYSETVNTQATKMIKKFQKLLGSVNRVSV